MPRLSSTLPSSPTHLEVVVVLQGGRGQPVLVVLPGADEKGKVESQVVRQDETLAVAFDDIVNQLIEEEEDPQVLTQLAAYLQYQSERLRGSVMLAPPSAGGADGGLGDEATAP